MKLRTFLLWFACAVAALAAPSAFANTTCTASAPGIVVGNYDGTAPQSGNTNVTVKCSTDVNSIFGGTAYVALCLYIGNTPQLVNGGNILNYHLYTASGRDWQGPSANPPVSQIITFNYPVGGLFSSGGSGTVNVQVTATIPAPPSAPLSVGTYSQSLTATTGEFQSSEPTGWGGNTTPLASCKSGGNYSGVLSPNNFTFSVSTTVAKSCQITAQPAPLDFGSAGGVISGSIDATTNITLNCISPTPWKAGLDNGLNFISTRRMTDGLGNFVAYDLYRDSGRSQRWGNTQGTDTLNGTGTGLNQTLNVYGRVSAPQNVAPGNYTDTITVNVYY